MKEKRKYNVSTKKATKPTWSFLILEKLNETQCLLTEIEVKKDRNIVRARLRAQQDGLVPLKNSIKFEFNLNLKEFIRVCLSELIKRRNEAVSSQR